MQIINTLPYAHPKYVTGETLLWDVGMLPPSLTLLLSNLVRQKQMGELEEDSWILRQRALVWKVPEARNALE
jgi:hypothetical protein